MRLLLSVLCWVLASLSAEASDYVAFEPVAGHGQMHYFISTPTAAAPTSALIVLHGHPRDAQHTLQATWHAVEQAGLQGSTVVIAPQFQVDPRQADRCSGPGVPDAVSGELTWTCRSWVEGESAKNSDVTSYAVLDALVLQIEQQWPSLKQITVAGFSAGGQMVQHYIGFAAERQAGTPKVRYVVGSPGSWLYFDAQRPDPVEDCVIANQWRYGTEQLPGWLHRTAAQARSHYAHADISYLAGALDSSDAPGTFYPILDKSCGAMSQGPFRLQRAQAFQAYDEKMLSVGKQRTLTVAPGCAHDVTCVFNSPVVRQALLGP